MKLDHIVIAVSELAPSVAFYSELLTQLGFDKRRDHVFVNAEGISFDIRQADDPAHRYTRAAPGLNHVGFTAPDRDAIVRVQTAMDNAGYEVPAIQAFDDGIALFLIDPDGMRVEISTYE